MRERVLSAARPVRASLVPSVACVALGRRASLINCRSRNSPAAAELPQFELGPLDELAIARAVSQLEFAHPEDATAAARGEQGERGDELAMATLDDIVSAAAKLFRTKGYHAA